jgi:hypothetical protein
VEGCGDFVCYFISFAGFLIVQVTTIEELPLVCLSVLCRVEGCGEFVVIARSRRCSIVFLEAQFDDM